jgi:hypothetical protein
LRKCQNRYAMHTFLNLFLKMDNLLEDVRIIGHWVSDFGLLWFMVSSIALDVMPLTQ